MFALVAAGILLLTFTWLVGQLGSFFTMIGIALFLSFALEPAVDYLATRGWKRGTATGLIFLILLGAIVLLVALIVPAVISGFNQLVQNAPALVDRLSNWLRPLGIKLSTDELIQKLQENAQQVISSATNVAGTVFGIASSLIGGLFRWATIALFTFYFVAEGPKFRRALLSRMRPDRQERVLFVWEQAIRADRRVLLLAAPPRRDQRRGDVRHPSHHERAVRGPARDLRGDRRRVHPDRRHLHRGRGADPGRVPGCPTGLASSAAGFWALGYVLVYQQIENYILSPRITAKTMSLHPAVAFAAALIGGALGGLFMAFLALPVAGVIQASVKEWSKSYEVVRDDLTPQEAAPKRSGLMERVRRSRDTPPATGDIDGQICGAGACGLSRARSRLRIASSGSPCAAAVARSMSK